MYGGSTGLGKYSWINIVKNCLGMMCYVKVLRLLVNLKRVNEYTTDNLLGEKCGYIVSCQLYGIWRRINIQKWVISINWCIATLTFVLHILIISDSIVLELLLSIPTMLLGSHGLNIPLMYTVSSIIQLLLDRKTDLVVAITDLVHVLNNIVIYLEIMN